MHHNESKNPKQTQKRSSDYDECNCCNSVSNESSDEDDDAEEPSIAVSKELEFVAAEEVEDEDDEEGTETAGTVAGSN